MDKHIGMGELSIRGLVVDFYWLGSYKKKWINSLINVLIFIHRLFHLQVSRCRFPSQWPIQTVWLTVIQLVHWVTTTFCQCPIKPCRETACLLAWHIDHQVQVTQVWCCYSDTKKLLYGVICAYLWLPWLC